ncbi:galactose mutarotase-like protein [Ceratobasidium sp. AG-Ba]|nr:galactose mutarotase-like protein [Ceratobasidium sp. AG-Ba]
MKLLQLALVSASLYTSAKAQTSDPFKQYTIAAPDGSITAKFIGSGASITELWVKDKYGRSRDVILGYDNTTLWQTDPDHPVFNSVVGRYANRIKNGTFSIPISKNPDPNSPNTYHIFKNDHDGQDTLHGGKIGWDRRNWTYAGSTPSSISFTHLDAADENFPGNVTAKVTYTLSRGGKFDISIAAAATKKTPIMLTSHIYWNLDAFQNGNKDVLGHRLRVGASKLIKLDNIGVPTGEIGQVQGTAFDFRKEQAIGWNWNATIGNGGCADCPGYDNPWVFDQPGSPAPNLSLYSPTSGIKLDITTNQPAIQVYTGNWLGTVRKAVHGGPPLIYDKYSAVAIEPEGYLDAINNPEWNVDQIYYPGRDFKWATTYQFSVVK